MLQVTGHPDYGLPWGQDRLVPIFLATLAVCQQSPRITFQSAAEMLGTFGMQPGGSQYRRLVAAFKRIFGATSFVGTDQQKKTAAVLHQSRFHFLRESEIWYSQNSESEGRESRPPWHNTVVVVSPDELKAAILLFYSLLDEQQRRLFAGLESMKLGRGATRSGRFPWP